MKMPYKMPGAGSSFEDEIKAGAELVESLPPEAFASFASLFDAMGRPEPICNPKETCQWAGPGFYRIEDDMGEDSSIEWVDEIEYLEEEAENGRDVFQFLCDEVPSAYRDFASKCWDGPGYYIAVETREKYWEEDPTYLTRADDVELLAEGLFRNLDLYSVQRMYKTEEETDTDFWFDCPETEHGKVFF